ncbi:MAG: hypothetical protein V4488_11295 [Pseudomonadota bacterium]
MPKVVFRDDYIKITTGENLSTFGTSYSQTLNDGITIEVKNPKARMIQFKSRTAEFTDGPATGTLLDLPEHTSSLDAPEWHVDAAKKTSVYYDEGGACKRTTTATTFADQPDISRDAELLFEQDKSLEQMKSYRVKNEFRALCFILVDGKVTRFVQWYRQKENGHSEYTNVVATDKINAIPLDFLQIIDKDGYSRPILA